MQPMQYVLEYLRIDVCWTHIKDVDLPRWRLIGFLLAETIELLLNQMLYRVQKDF